MKPSSNVIGSVSYKWYLKYLVILVIVIMSLAIGFSVYALRYPRYMYKRVAAALHAFTAITLFVIIELVKSGGHPGYIGNGNRLEINNEQNNTEECEGLGAKRAAQRRIYDELGIPSEHCPVEQMVYLTRILYNSPSCGKWGEHELDYILFFKDYNNKIIPQPNPNEIKVLKLVKQILYM